MMGSSIFLSTPSARRATYDRAAGRYEFQYFYPRPLRGGRHTPSRQPVYAERFLSTPSARRATLWCWGHAACLFISIHALCEEGDYVAGYVTKKTYDFYPRPLRGGRRFLHKLCHKFNRFLSTPSARRATAKTETKSLFSNKLYNILHEFRRALIYNGSKSYPNHAK